MVTEVGFEPTPLTRPQLECGALDRSAIQPLCVFFENSIFINTFYRLYGEWFCTLPPWSGFQFPVFSCICAHPLLSETPWSIDVKHSDMGAYLAFLNNDGSIESTEFLLILLFAAISHV